MSFISAEISKKEPINDMQHALFRLLKNVRTNQIPALVTEACGRRGEVGDSVDVLPGAVGHVGDGVVAKRGGPGDTVGGR